MGRKPRDFTPMQIADMVRLFNAGESTERIGQRQTPPASAQVVGRALGARLGDLRAAKAVMRMRRSLERGRLTYLDYREGFAAGYRMAQTHTKLYGVERMREYWSKYLLLWREMGLDDIPPEFVRI